MSKLRYRDALLIVFWACVLLAFRPQSAFAAQPPVQFLGAPSPAFSGGVQFPIGLAGDTSGNLYVADCDSYKLLKESAQPDGSYSQSTIASGFNSCPVGLAVDNSGNLFVGLDGEGLIKETLQKDGTYVRSSLVSTGYYYGVAVDSSGNVYGADYDDYYYSSSQNYGAVTKFMPSGGTYTATAILAATSQSGGYQGTNGVAVDSSGHVFATASYGNAIYELTPAGNPATTTNYVATSYSVGSGTSAFNIAVDSADNLYIADASGKLRLETPNGSGGYTETILASGLSLSYGVTVTPTGKIYFGVSGAVDEFSPAAINMGGHPVRSTTGATTLNYTIQPGVTVSAINVGTEGTRPSQSGAPEFVQASGSTCAAQSYSAVTTCSVKVTFTPQYPGLRTGAVQFLDGSGNVLNTVYLYGTGTAPVVGFLPAPASLLSATGLATPVSAPQRPVVDAAGDVYFADAGNNRIVEITPGGAASVVNIPGMTLSAPSGVAVDGAGNLFIADSGNGRVVELTAQGTATVLDTNSLALSSNYGVAVDPSGNVYTTDATNNRVLVFPVNGAAYVLNTPGVTLGSVYAVAADGAGDLFIADYSNSQIVKVSKGTASVMATDSLSPALLNPQAVSVDAMGNVYISDSGNNRIVEVLAGTAQPIVLNAPGYTLDHPAGVGAGNSGDLYIADAGNNRIVVSSPEAAPSLKFADTMPGEMSSDSPQTVTLLNLGNQPLSFAAPQTGMNPSIASGFGYDSASTCPQVSASGGSASVAAGASCTYALNFTPGDSGSFSGALVLTDNNLNASGATQSIALSGNGVVPGDTTATTTSVSANALVSGDQITVTAHVTDSTDSSKSPAGTVIFTDTAGTDSITSPSLPVSGGVATWTFAPSVGTHVVTAVFTPTEATQFHSSSDAEGAHFSVAAATTTTASAAGATYSAAAHAVTLSATVSSSYGAVNSGTVTFTLLHGTSVVGSAVSSQTVIKGTATVSYNLPADLAAGTYTIEAVYNAAGSFATSQDTSHVLTVGKATATVTLGSLNQTYTGSALPATATTNPEGLNVTFTYNGSAAAPMAAGTYAVVGTVSDANYQGSASGTLVIGKATAAVTLASLNQTYTGSALPATATTNPAGLKVSLTYNGSAAAPTVSGSYVVVATINDANYQGSASGTLAIGKATAAVTLASLNQTYTGSALPATATTNPEGLKVSLTYNGADAAPAAVGSYAVVGTINDANYQGSASGTLVIGKATAGLTLGSLAQTYTGSPLAATASTVPAGVKVVLTYNGSAQLPVAAGSYTVVGTVNDASYQGTASGTLVINKVPTALTVTSSGNPVLAQAAVVLKAVVSSAAGAPADGEPVTFYDNTTAAAIGQGILTGGVATLNTSGLKVGTHSITAMFSGDANYAAGVSTSISELVQDFNLNLSTGAASGSVTSTTVLPGGTAVFRLTISPVGATTFPAAVNLSASGLPAGATYSFSPATLAAGSGPQTVTLTIQIPQTSAAAKVADARGAGGIPVIHAAGGGHGEVGSLTGIALAVLLLPFGGRLRKAGWKLGRGMSLLLLLIAGIAGASAVTGCGANSSGYFGQSQKTYVVTVTGTSGALSHSTTVQLTVE